ncbi:MAG: tetratricopeptide repeat protein [Anaerolineales bacterium]|nr:tetratricopeptide repeat protein [Anaerolineales bacterium]
MWAMPELFASVFENDTYVLYRWQPQNMDPFQEALIAGNTDLVENGCRQGMEPYTLAVDMQPRNGLALLRLAECTSLGGRDPAGALAFAEQGVALLGDHPWAMQTLASILMNTRQPVSPQYGDMLAIHQRAVERAEQGRHPELIDTILKSLYRSLQPTVDKPQLATLVQQIIGMADRNYATDPTRGHQTQLYRNYVQAGLIYAAAGNVPRAQAMYARAIALQPETPDASLALAALLQKEGRQAEALNVLADATVSDDSQAWPYVARGKLYLNQLYEADETN